MYDRTWLESAETVRFIDHLRQRREQRLVELASVAASGKMEQAPAISGAFIECTAILAEMEPVDDEASDADVDEVDPAVADRVPS